MSPSFISTLLFLLGGTCTAGIVDTLIAIHSEDDLRLSVVQGSYLYLILYGSFSLFGMPLGLIIDESVYLSSQDPERESQSSRFRFLMLFVSRGFFLSGLAAIALGTLSTNLYSDDLATRVIFEAECIGWFAVGQVAVMVAILPAMRVAASMGALSKTFSKQSASSSQSDSMPATAETEAVMTWFNMVQQSGRIIGPIIATYQVMEMGFDASLALLGVVAGCCSVLYWVLV